MKHEHINANKARITMEFRKYEVTFRNKYGYTVVVTDIYNFGYEETEEQARLALSFNGYIESAYELVKIERI